MLKNIVARYPEEIIERTIEFTSSEGYGFSFSADEKGNPIFDNEDQKSNYEYAINHEEEFDEQFDEFIVRRRIYMNPARGTCRCGTEVVLEDRYMGATSCPTCGQWYNIYGQELVDPEYWED